MIPNWPFWIKKSRLFQKCNVLVINSHQSTSLGLDDFLLNLLLHLLAQAGDMSSINSSGVGRLKLREQFDVLIVGLDAMSTQYAFNLFLLEWIRHVYRLIIFSWTGGARCDAGR